MLLRAATLLAFERDGHVTTRGILPQAAVERAIPAIDAAYESQLAAVLAQKLRVILGDDEAERLKGAPLKVLQQRVAALPEGSVPFLQGFNLWRTCPAVASLAASDELAGAAAELLGVPRVRLFQDSLFVKRPNDGETHWHSDLAMAPLDTNHFVTCWLPLQPVPPEDEGGTGLIFASGSHRDVALHFWHGDPSEEVDCSERGYSESVSQRLDVGDATWHHGWTLHCAAPNFSPRPRRALALSFFGDGDTRRGGPPTARRLKAPRRKPHTEDAESHAAWLPDVPPGKPARHALLPLVWDGATGGAQRITATAPTRKPTTPQRPQKQKPKQQQRGRGRGRTRGAGGAAPRR